MAGEIEELFEREGRRIYSLLLRLTGNPDEAEDLTQEVFLKAARGYSGFEERSTAGTWLYRIAINAARDRWRRRRHPTESYEAALQAGRPVEPATAPEATSAALLQEEARRLLNEGLASLDPAAREVILLRESEGLSYQQMAETLGIPMGTVQSRLARARSALREAIHLRHPDWEP